MNSTYQEMAHELAGARGEVLIEKLFEFMEAQGQSNYDKSVTQLEHALQCADLARERDLGEQLVVAALFHDIGHLLLNESADHSDFLAEDLDHERIGADFLDAWFPAEVTEPIRLHVPAKRYLCSTDPAYFDQLSLASQRSFQVQGGNLSPAKQRELEQNEYLQLALALRRIDDEGKQAGKPVPPIAVYKQAAMNCLRGSAK